MTSPRKSTARLVLVSSLLALLAIVAAGCGGGGSSSASGSGQIPIAWIGDRSGPTASAQQPVLDGLQAYVRRTNANGGVDGDRIRLIVRDDQYNPATELQLVKRAVKDDRVVLVTGIGNSSGLPSVMPYLTQQRVPGLINQGTLKEVSSPFHEWIFEGNCNYADQADVALGYVMQQLGVEDLRGKRIGIAGIEVASGQEWIDILRTRVADEGGTSVVETLPSAIVNADVQVQGFVDAGVDAVLVHHAPVGGIALLKSMSKYGMTETPVSGSFGVTQDFVWTRSPRDVARNFVGTNCYTPPAIGTSDEAKLAVETAKRYGYPSNELQQANFALGWVNGMMIVRALENAGGTYTGESVKDGLEQIGRLDVGDLAPAVDLSTSCHMAIRQVRPYEFDFAANAMKPIGSYGDWAKYVTNAYAAPGTCGT